MRGGVRVLLVNDLAPGPGSGAEVHLARLAAALREAGDEVAVFAGEVVHRGAGRVLDVWDPRARRRLAALAERFRPDVVHHHNILRELSVSVATAVPGAASVHSVHDWRLLRAHEGAPGAGRRTPLLLAKELKGAFDRAVLRRHVDAVVAPSTSQAEALRAAGFRHVHVVPYFSDPGPEPPPPGDDVVYAGQLVDYKGVDVLIDAFASIAHRHPGATLHIAGDGAERAALEARARPLGPRVRFHGVVGEAGVRALLARARVVCTPSNRTTEGAPIAAAEGLLAGRPVVATDSAAFRELLADGELGAIVPLGDAAALAAELDRFLADPALAAKVGARARQRALARFATPAGVSALRGVYREAMARRG